MYYERCNPDAILKRIYTIKKEKHNGHLKIFFGYAAGVGKTYTMLKAAHEMKSQGTDVVVGYIEPHPRSETNALLEGLESIPPLVIQHNGMTLHEFDLEAALARKPQLLLVDELAHSNTDQARHVKRYQDIQELLKAGIDVYTTVNVQHIESLNDLVSSLTGVTVRERIPDHFFDEADQVNVVDIEPDDLLIRLKEGKIYNQQQAEKAVKHFFKLENLITLREITLRRTADRIHYAAEKTKSTINNGFYANEHILVCLSASPSNDKLIRTAARMAHAFKCHFTAIFVETPDYANWSESNKARLIKNIRLAEQLGATIEKVFGEDVAFHISEFARYTSVTKIVIGRTNTKRSFLHIKKSFTELLTQLAPNLDIHVIPDQQSKPFKTKKNWIRKHSFSSLDIVKVLGALAITTALGYLFKSFSFDETNIINMYMLGVLGTAIITANLFCSILMAVLSVLAFNFFFTYPIFSLNAYNPSYPVTFIIMFITAFTIGTLASKLRMQARQSAETAYRTKILLETNQLLQQSDTSVAILETSARQLVKLLNRTVVYYPVQDAELSSPVIIPKSQFVNTEELISVNEQAVATWSYNNSKQAGASTNTLNSAKCLYLAVKTNLNVYGVISISLNQGEILDTFEKNLVLSIIGECALALEKEHFIRQREEAVSQAKNEQLRANLLRAISHDLRTPLTTISGNANILLVNGTKIEERTKIRLYEDIYDDAKWLINLVENLLSITRIEDGSMNIYMKAELIEEVIHEALKHINRKSSEHIIKVEITDSLLLAKIDARLIIQVFINLIDNAIKYTPVGSEIIISTKKKDSWIIVDIADNGYGIDDAAKENLFEMFYSASKNIADGRRGMGIGLALCKSIIQAHGGSLTVHDQKPSGAIFRFTLQSQEVNL